MINRIACFLGLTCLLAMTVQAQDKAEPAVKTPATKTKKKIWADSLLWTDAPTLEFAKWLGKKPDMKGKFVIVEFWRTWCGACKRVTPRMNALQKTFGKDLVVIAVTAEKDAVVKAYKGPKKLYFMALDKPRPVTATPDEDKDKAKAGDDEEETPVAIDPKNFRKEEQGQLEAHFGVRGWPHAVLLEPTHRCVVWEGYPDLKGYELTEKKLAQFIAIHKKALAKKEAKK